MQMIAAAIVISACSSPVEELHGLNTTVFTSCPNTVRFIYEEWPETPKEAKRMQYYWSLDRDDRATVAAPVVKPKPKAAHAKKAVKHKHKAKAKKKKTVKKKRRR